MKTRFFLLTFLFAAVCTLNVVAQSPYEIIPLPKSISIGKGNAFAVSENTVVSFSSKNNPEDTKRIAGFLTDYINKQTGWNWQVKENCKKEAGDVVLQYDAAIQNDEGYRLVVNKKNVIISAKTPNGLFYGVQSLRKIIRDKSVTSLPSVIINDEPRFEYRGVHLDCARHFFPISFVKKYIDIIALHNCNRFHWHLTDDQGWRFEVKAYPELTEKGAWREETMVGHNFNQFDGKPYGGYYTQEQCREIVRYAAERFIEVIPEVDMPGHMQGALAAYPQLGCTGGPYKVWTQWGVSEDVLCAGNPKTIEFLHGVLDELTDVFPSEYIHLGGDECPKTRWAICPKCQTKIKELDFFTFKGISAENQLQSYLLADAEKYLANKGRKIIGWDEVLDGFVGPNTTIMSWRGIEGGSKAAKLHRNVIMTPTSNCYLNFYQSEDRDSEPISFDAFLPIYQVYSLEPVPEGLTEEEASYIKGCQANLWSEYITTGKQAEHMLLPRLAAICESQWMQPEAKNYDDFLNRLPALMNLYDNLKLDHGQVEKQK